MVDGQVAAIHAHRSNIQRYRRLLETHLTDIERQYIECRLSEEQAALQHSSAAEQIARIGIVSERLCDQPRG